MSDDLAQVLRRLEEELHRQETRRDVRRMRVLLHPDFEEVGCSGRHYRSDDVLRELNSGENARIFHADDFVASQIRDGVALLTYRSFNLDADGMQSRVTLRSSLWVETAAGWQMRFHQGTLATGKPDAA